MSESDRDFRRRIIDAYGMWGAFCTVVLESSGTALDEVGLHVGLLRLNDTGSHDPGDEDVTR